MALSIFKSYILQGKPLKKKCICIGCIFILLIICFTSTAQTPLWKWSKGIGGNGQDGLLGYNSNTFSGSMHVDTSGNVYELITSPSSSIIIGASTFNNSGGGSGASVGYFVKYNPQGAVLWVKQLPHYAANLGGAPIIPVSMYTNKQGYSYLLLTVYSDTFTLGGFTTRDSSLHLSAFRSGYCIAEYDPAGNVISLNSHVSPANGGWIRILQFTGNQILGLGLTNNVDTLNGHAVARGYFLSLMDSLGNVNLTKSIGYDSSGAFLSASGITVGGQSVFISLTYFHHPFVYQTNLPIGSLTPYINGSKYLVAKFDSMLNFQWLKATSINISSPIMADLHDNVYIGALGLSSIPEDTFIFDTTHIVLPYVSPSGQNAYMGLLKIDGTGILQWIDKFLVVTPAQVAITGLCIDVFDNIYALGRYGSYLALGIDTFNDPANIFVAKINKSGSLIWSQSSKHAQGRTSAYGIGADGHGNIFVNGLFADPNAHPFFGSDSLICHTPVSGYPLAADVFTTRLGNCSPFIPAITASSPLSWCGRDSVILTASLASGYLWSNSDTNRSIVVKTSGQYNVYAIDSFGCYAQSADQNIKASPKPILSASVTQNVSCYGGNDGRLSILATGGTAPLHTSYTPSLININQASANTYIITTIDTASCMAKDTVTVTQPPTAVAINATVIQNVNCFGGNDGMVAVQTTGGTRPYTYGYVPTLTNLNQARASTYIMTATDSLGCAAHDTITVTQPATSLNTHMDSIHSTMASGNGMAIVIASGATPPYTYLWNTSPAQSQDTATHLSFGWYTVIVTDHNGCIKSDSVLIRLYNSIAETQSNDINAYPNPSTGVFFIKSSIQAYLQVYALDGREMGCEILNIGTNRIDTYTLANGMYQVVVSTFSKGGGRGEVIFSDMMTVRK